MFDSGAFSVKEIPKGDWGRNHSGAGGSKGNSGAGLRGRRFVKDLLQNEAVGEERNSPWPGAYRN